MAGTGLVLRSSPSNDRVSKPCLDSECMHVHRHTYMHKLSNMELLYIIIIIIIIIVCSGILLRRFAKSCSIASM